MRELMPRKKKSSVRELDLAGSWSRSSSSTSTFPQKLKGKKKKMSDCALEPPQDVAKAVAKATAKRPRRSSSRPGSASSGSKSGGAERRTGTAKAASRVNLVSRRKNLSLAAAPEDDATTTPPALFFYSNLHDAVRAELSALLASVAAASSSVPVLSNEPDVDVVDVVVDGRKNSDAPPTTVALPAATARSRALADVAARARLLEKVHAYHSAVEDEVRESREDRNCTI
jgi:hypothetical protein